MFQQGILKQTGQHGILKMMNMNLCNAASLKTFLGKPTLVG
jgi:hypothetical protein